MCSGSDNLRFLPWLVTRSPASGSLALLVLLCEIGGYKSGLGTKPDPISLCDMGFFGAIRGRHKCRLTAINNAC